MTTPASPKTPRVGVGVIVLHDGLVLLGRRLGSHGAGTWALPGGHLDYGESIADCAAREVLEETGLTVEVTARGPYANDVLPEGSHYVTLFIVATAPLGDAQVLEPAKCAAWQWFRWSELPEPLFMPLVTLRATGYIPEGAA